MPQTTATPQEIAVRLEKLRFVTDELVIAANLAGSATNSDMARMLARHVGVRIADFISHARQLRNLLPASPASTAVKETMNAFADEFEENLALSRHKLGAHVQDMDFLQRIDIWVSIDTSKIDYFAQGARELWDLLGTTGVAGHEPFVSPTVLADPSAASVLAYLASPVTLSATFGTDPLSFARANTHSIYNGTPVHVRAGQLALLRRWMRVQRELLALFQPHASIARIIKARIITDIVSFRDCLITRPVAANAPQAMDGLDALIVAAGKVPEAIQAFVASSRDDATIEPMRDLRNRVGGHLEIEPAVTLAALLTELDQFDLAMAIRHYASLEAVFIETCRRTGFLTTHLIDGMDVGAVLVPNAEAAPFDASRPDIAAGPPASLTFTQAEMQEHLDQWTSGYRHLRHAALDYFREAFARAPVAETRVRVEQLGGGWRNHHLEIKTSHMFLRDALIAATPGEEEDILLLASQCPGYRDALTDVLTEYHRATRRAPSSALLRALGTLAPWWLDDAREIVEAAIKSGKGADGMLARVVLMRIFIREEGPKRLNNAPGHIPLSRILAKSLANVPAAEELATLVALASTFIARDTAIFIRKFAPDYRTLADAALAAAKRLLGGALDVQREAQLHDMLQRGNIGQALLHIHDTGPRGHARPAKQALTQAFVLGVIETGTSSEEGTAVAEFLLHCDAPEAALNVLERLRRRSPGEVAPALRMVEILADIEGEADFAEEIAGQIREQFNLDPVAEARLSEAEAKCRRA